MNNLDVIELKENLVKELNKSQVPVVVKQLVLKEILGTINSLIPQALEYEMKNKEGEKDGQSI